MRLTRKLLKHRYGFLLRLRFTENPTFQLNHGVRRNDDHARHRSCVEYRIPLKPRVLENELVRNETAFARQLSNLRRHHLRLKSGCTQKLKPPRRTGSQNESWRGTLAHFARWLSR